MLKCVVQDCDKVCYNQCAFRITPQRAEAIKQLNVVHKTVGNVDNVCSVCGKRFIDAKHQGKSVRLCGCHIE